MNDYQVNSYGFPFVIEIIKLFMDKVFVRICVPQFRASMFLFRCAVRLSLEPQFLGCSPQMPLLYRRTA